LYLRGKRVIRIVFLLLGGILLFHVKSEGLMERRYLYFPDKELVLTPDRYGIPYEDVTFQTEDGLNLHGWFVQGEKDRPVVLFCHGNAGNISHRINNLGYFRQLGLSVLIFDYRGYGRSEGSPSEEGLYRDGRAALAWLKSRGWAKNRTVYFGRSLGAGIALQLAIEVPPAGLVLETPFTSLAAMGRHHYPILQFFLGWLLNDRYDNLSKIASLRSPLLIFQGDRDTIVPEKMARALFEKAGEPKEFHLIQGADHNDTYDVGGEAYWEVWKEFLEGIAPR